MDFGLDDIIPLSPLLIHSVASTSAALVIPLGDSYTRAGVSGAAVRRGRGGGARYSARYVQIGAEGRSEGLDLGSRGCVLWVGRYVFFLSLW